MTIILDAYQYGKSITGTDRMACNYLLQLQQIDKKNQYIVICSNEKYTSEVVQNKNFKIIRPLRIRSSVIQRIINKIWRILLPLFLTRYKADTYLSFHNMTLPSRRLAKKMIASNLDLIPIMLDDYKNLGKISPHEQQLEYTRVANLADRLVSISNYSKNELSNTINIPKSKIDVIHLAADASFSANERNAAPEHLKDDSYILTIGGSEPRKNVETVIAAHRLLPEALRKTYKLRIAGGRWHGRTLSHQNDPNIIQLGYVGDKSLPALYANAFAFIFASKYEGFGFTILEAMACGTPVINARGSSLDEVAGNATLSFDANDPQELADNMIKLLTDNTLRKKLVSLGYRQNKNFSWENAAKQLHKIITS